MRSIVISYSVSTAHFTRILLVLMACHFDLRAGSLHYSSYLGGKYADGISGIAADDAGNVFVVGTTSSPDFPVTNNRPLVEGESAAFVSKFRSDGILDYSICLRQMCPTSGNAIALDREGNAYI